MEGAPFEVVNWRSNRTTEMSASDLVEDSLDSVKVLSEEEVFKILLQSKLGVSEVTDEVKKYYDEYLPLFKQVVEEVESESQEEK
jgi:exonuclease SbcD